LCAMAARRKLFLTHAGELAHHLVSAIARDGMAMEFVRGYAARNDRQKVMASAERLREMESTISREALLLIAADVRRLLPRAFGSSANSDSDNGTLCGLFYTEFLEALGRAMNWPVTEGEAGAHEFQRDLEMYATWRERNPQLRSHTKASVYDSPFPDRCAILLDSAMMEKARRAAAEFQPELLRLGRSIFGRLGSASQGRRPSGHSRPKGKPIRPRIAVRDRKRNGHTGQRKQD